MEKRQRKEIYSQNGTPEKKFVSGIYRRAYAAPRSKGPRLEEQ